MSEKTAAGCLAGVYKAEKRAAGECGAGARSSRILDQRQALARESGPARDAEDARA
jgi:hypothetical protein